MPNFSEHRGTGVVNTLINKLTFEIHLPGYQFCGPGTKLEKRLAEGQQGINSLDKACRAHYIFYNQNRSSVSDWHKADWELENRAWERVKSADASIGEKTAAC